MEKYYLKGILLFIGTMLLFQFGCQDKFKEHELSKLNFDKWEKSEKGDEVTVFYTDTSWAFVHHFLDTITDKEDSIVLGPFEGHQPILDQFEFFNDDKIDKYSLDEEDNRWVVEYLSSEGCRIIIFGIVKGKITVLEKHLLKDRNCDRTFFDKDLKHKTILGTSYDNDSLDILVINYHTGKLLGKKRILNGNYEDLEILNGHLVTIKQKDSVYIDVTLSTDIKTKYVFPGTFVKAKENSDGCKVIVIKNGDGYFSYILCPEIPIDHISSGNYTYGDKLTDLQTHRFRDTTRYVIGTYDSINNRTRVDVLDKEAVRVGNFEDVGKQKKAIVICDNRVKFFVLEDNSRGIKKLMFNAININNGKSRNINPSIINGDFVSIEASDNPCGVTITYKDSQGKTKTQLVLIN